MRGQQEVALSLSPPPGAEVHRAALPRVQPRGTCCRHSLAHMRGWRQQWLPLALSLAAVAQCNAVTARPRRGKDQSDEAVAPSPVRKWLDRPATKGAILVVAGGVSGAIAKTATAPLERAKLMSQAGQTANFLQLMGEVRKYAPRRRPDPFPSHAGAASRRRHPQALTAAARLRACVRRWSRSKVGAASGAATWPTSSAWCRTRVCCSCAPTCTRPACARRCPAAAARRLARWPAVSPASPPSSAPIRSSSYARAWPIEYATASAARTTAASGRRSDRSCRPTACSGCTTVSA